MLSQDWEQFLRVYDQYADAIFRHCYFRVYNRDKALDLMQDAFMKTWEYLAQGKTVDNMRAFLYRVANNLIIDASRKKIPYSLDDLQEGGFEPVAETHAVDPMDKKLLATVLEKLDEDARQVLVWRYLDELSIGEIATILGVRENVVSVRLHRGLKKARKRLLAEQPNYGKII